MQIKVFRAIDMKKALAMIKAEMGSNAVILNSRKVKNGGAFGIFSRPVMEVTAVLDEDIREKSRNSSRLRKSFRAKTDSSGANNLSEFTSALDPLRDDINRLKELVGSSVNVSAYGQAEIKKAAELAGELAEMKSMVGFMLEQSDFYKGTSLPPNYFACYRRLVQRGVEEKFALKIINAVRKKIPGGRDMELRYIVERVMEHIGESMIIGSPIDECADTPRVVSLIGPTGVGKTTTIAKIAAQLSAKNRKVGLITIDTYRIAAVEQIKTYADILKMPLEVALTPGELIRAISSYSEKDVILIDTAGSGQRDSEKLGELASFLGGNELLENYLVLSAASDSATLDEAVANFGCVPLAGLIFSKLDESRKPGAVISQNFKTGLPVIYCTNGQKVPEDIENASPVKLGTRLFKRDAA